MAIVPAADILEKMSRLEMENKMLKQQLGQSGTRMQEAADS